MKKLFIIFAAVLITATVFLPRQASAQTPQKMSYQAVIRNSSDQLVTNQGIGMQVSILQTTATGTAVYVETHNTTTNANGLVSVEIGNGTVVSGDFATIDWATDVYFIKTETDPTTAGGTTYTITGTSQLLSVAYALHAKTAETITGTVNYTETDPVFTSSQANNITAQNITDLGNLSGTNTGDQDISGIAVNTQAIQDTASQIRADIPDVSGFVSTETDPIYTSSQANNITAQNITDLGNLSNTNTGDQDISGIAVNTQAIQDTASQIRADIPDVSGFVSTETDPVFTSSQANNITAQNITDLSNLSGTNTGDQDISGIAINTQAIQDTASQIRADIPDVSGFISTETDPVFTSSEANNITAQNITDLSNLSGTNTGDQNISGIAVNTQAIQDTASQIRADIPDVSGFISTETDPVFTSSQANNITAQNITDLGNLSNTNTGDQDISGIAVNTQAIQDTASQIRADIPDVSGFISTETDPVFTSSQANNITAQNITDLSNLSGTNTGDQDGSETKLTAGTNITVTGTGTTASPYVVNATSGSGYSIGDFAQGGIVFWLDETGEHGLVCAKTDQDGGSGVRWYAGTYTYTMAKGNGPYAGELNTAIIIANQGNGDGNTYAARVCNELQITEGGKTYGDWYLPSKQELNLMYVNRTTINTTAIANGGVAFATSSYWSSTEYSNYTAWVRGFSNGYQLASTKYYTYRVRAVRAF